MTAPTVAYCKPNAFPISKAIVADIVILNAKLYMYFKVFHTLCLYTPYYIIRIKYIKYNFISGLNKQVKFIIVKEEHIKTMLLLYYYYVYKINIIL